MTTLQNGSRFGTFLRATFIASMALGVAACSKDKNDTYTARDVNVLYNLGVERQELRQHSLAAMFFDEVERQHPYSSWARNAQLMAAYSYYEGKQYDDAINTIERFLSLHPGNKAAPYAYYLTSISYYDQIMDVGRDQRLTEQAMKALQEVVSRFPDTEYAKDARLKLDLTRDHLAGKEMEVGRFYLKQEQFVASIMRFRNVIENYQTTSHTPEALHRLVESYLSMGIEDEAQALTAVLGYNFPETKWYRYSYSLLTKQDLEPKENKRSWINRIF